MDVLSTEFLTSLIRYQRLMHTLLMFVDFFFHQGNPIYTTDYNDEWISSACHPVSAVYRSFRFNCEFVLARTWTNSRIRCECTECEELNEVGNDAEKWIKQQPTLQPCSLTLFSHNQSHFYFDRTTSASATRVQLALACTQCNVMMMQTLLSRVCKNQSRTITQLTSSSSVSETEHTFESMR